MGAIEVELVRDTVDWALVVVAVLTAVGTVGAVAVALLGPMWTERRKRPDVRLVVHRQREHAGLEWSWLKDIDVDRPDETQDYPPVWITNERGKLPAQNVEVFVSVGRDLGHGRGSWLTVARRDNLLFDSPIGANPARAQTHVPPGFSRRVFFLTFGHPLSIHEGLEDDGAAEPSDANVERLLGIVARNPPRRSSAAWLEPGHYAVTFFITGSNFDAVTYVGHFAVGRSELGRTGGRSCACSSAGSRARVAAKGLGSADGGSSRRRCSRPTWATTGQGRRRPTANPPIVIADRRRPPLAAATARNLRSILATPRRSNRSR